MSRLPTPGSDEGQWGQVLNDFLLQSLAADGTIKPNAVTVSSLQDSSISSIKLQDGAVTNAKLAIAGGNDNQVLIKDTAASGGVTWANAPSGQIYPLEEGYGYHAASVSFDSATSTGWFAGWMTRVWVPANRSITKAAMFITTAAAGASTLTGFGIYSDDGQTLLGQGTDTTIFLSTGLRPITLSTAIPAQTTGRFVRVLVSTDHSTKPYTEFVIDGGPTSGIMWNNPVMRTAYFNGVGSAFPTSFDPVTGASLSGWTPTNYLPPILLG